MRSTVKNISYLKWDQINRTLSSLSMRHRTVLLLHPFKQSRRWSNSIYILQKRSTLNSNQRWLTHILKKIQKREKKPERTAWTQRGQRGRKGTMRGREAAILTWGSNHLCLSSTVSSNFLALSACSPLFLVSGIEEMAIAGVPLLFNNDALTCKNVGKMFDDSIFGLLSFWTRLAA